MINKVKFEMMRWAVSTVTNASQRVREEVEEEPKKVMPKRLRRSSDADDEEKDSVED